MKRFVLGLTLLAAVMSLLMLSAVSASAASLTLAWDSSPSTVAGYLVSWGTRSGAYDHTLDVGNALSAPVPGLADGTNYYFVVQAYSSNFTLSAYSNEVSGQTPTLATPLSIMCSAPTATSTDGNPVKVQVSTTVAGGTPPVATTCSPASGSLFPVGSTPVTCSAVDTLKATASCSTAVVVNGPPPPPTITCPQPKATSTDGQAVPLTFAPTVSGGVDPLNVSCTPPSGSLFPVGTTTLTCTVTDALGRKASCTASGVVSSPKRNHGKKH
jgi:Fibronectin type III domain/HYR domain